MNMRKKFTISLIVSLLFLFGISDHVVGQVGVLAPEYLQNANQQGITPRRGHSPGVIDTIRGPLDINNEFGAGESVTIGNNLQIIDPSTNQLVSTNGGLTSIHLGSQNSKNIVINSYNADGFAAGWINLTIWGGTSSATAPAPTMGARWDGSIGYQFDDIPGTIKANVLYAGSWETDTHLHLFYWHHLWADLSNRSQVNANVNGSTLPTVTNNWATFGPMIDTDAKAEDFYNKYKDTGKGMYYSTTTAIAATQAPRRAADAAYLNTLTTANPGISSTTINPTNYRNDTGGMRYLATPKLNSELPFTTTREISPTSPFYGTVREMRGYKDNDISLLQFNGASLSSKTEDTAVKLNWPNNPAKRAKVAGTGTVDANGDYVVPGQDNGTLKSYVRPTTVSTASNTFNDIIFSKLGWWYRTYNTPGAEPTVTIVHADIWTCGHSSLVVAGTQDIIDWQRDSFQGDTYLDAAVQLLNGAMVCVSGNVMDETGNIGNSADDDRTGTTTGSYTMTNALIILPSEDRFTLRTRGDFKANMHHERVFPTDVAHYYTADEFPDPDPNIYMMASRTTPQPFAPSFVSGFNGATLNSGVKASIGAPDPYVFASIFGVYGDYLHEDLMAEIHTSNLGTPTTPTFGDRNQGVIEVGEFTAGKEHFHIYSNGTLKNFEGCVVAQNFAMNFGDNYGGMPELIIDELDPLNIVNYGNNGNDGCAAWLVFWAGSAQVIADAFTNATDQGAIRLQGFSGVEFNEDLSIDATYQGNNLFVLSDAGNIITQKFDMISDYVGETGQGTITFWAEDRTYNGINFNGCSNVPADNRNGLRGNIYLNDEVTITRPSNDNSTETNFIAANNIRTGSFTVNTENNIDVTNIISRKGDLYLGYGSESNNVFTYNGDGDLGTLNIKAGFDDLSKDTQYRGGNIYFTQLDANMSDGNEHHTNISIPFSNEYLCGSGWTIGKLHQRSMSNGSMMLYEHSGIIGGLGRCGSDSWWNNYAGKLANPTPSLTATNPSLNYLANNGNLNISAGDNGNIIMNTGSKLNFQENDGNAFFRTRKGDIDMRGVTDVSALTWQKGVVFLADNGNSNKEGINCICEEEFNNVYIQDLNFIDFSEQNNGSIYFGADNNIKLQYGGLKKLTASWIDPFLAPGGYEGNGVCGTSTHCDSDPNENKAREMILDFSGQPYGGVGIVASDLIDIYKEMIYTGFKGAGLSGMSAVPGPGNGMLHGENVAGYGLYIKSQGNKSNWAYNPFDTLPEGYCPPFCSAIECGSAYLHQVARVTFHDDARFRPGNSKAFVASPVLEVFGNLELNTEQDWGSNSMLRIQTDSLILHDSLIIKGNKLQLSTWSNLPYDAPVIKLGHKRTQPPYADECTNCVPHRKGVKGKGLDTIFIKYENDPPPFERLYSLVADHTVLSFLTDSFDNVKGKPVLDARFYTDIFKVRNQVELWSDARRKHSGHLELISEIQMFSKDYSGIFTRHLHMEPIGPACSHSKYSELWIPYPALDVITSSKFGGFGTLYADVHVETQGIIAPGYASLGTKGNCYEQMSGTLKMQNLHMDGGAELHYSIGDKKGYDGWETDILEVDNLVAYGTIKIFVEKRCGQKYEPGCYPIILYNTVGKDNLNNLKLGTLMMDNYPLALDFSTPGIVYLCVGTPIIPLVQREVIVPTPPPGVSIYPVPGVHWVPWGRSFTFTLNFSGTTPYLVTTNRPIDPRTGTESEILVPKLNANGEYEYTIPVVKTQPILIYIGPELYFGEITANEAVNRNGVWSSGNTLYINVNQQDIASIYSVTGALVQRIEVPVGGTSVPMQRGAFIVTLKDGSVHKVIIR